MTVWRRNVVAVYAMCVVMYGSRASISPLLLMMSEDLGYDRDGIAVLLASFSFGYIWLQVLAGVVSQRIGSKIVMLVAMLGCGLSLLAVSCCRSSRQVGLALGMLGVFHAPMMPVRFDIYARWVPVRDRGSVITYEGVWSLLGILAFTYCSPKLAAWFGWRSVFVAQAVVQLGCAVCWQMYTDASPDTSRIKISAEELAVLPKLAPTQTGEGDANSKCGNRSGFPWWLFTRRATWALVIAHTAGNYGGRMIEAWQPLFYKDTLGVPPDRAAVYFMLPSLAGLGGRFLLGRFVPVLSARAGWSTLQLRCYSSHAACFGSAAACAAFAHAQSVSLATAALCAHKVFECFHSSGYGASYLEVGADNTSVLTGVGNTIANVGSLVAPVLGATLLRTFDNSWLPVFYSSGAFYAIATCFYARWIATQAELPNDDHNEVQKKK